MMPKLEQKGSCGATYPLPLPGGGTQPLPFPGGGTAPLPLPLPGGGTAPLPLPGGGTAPLPLPGGVTYPLPAGTRIESKVLAFDQQVPRPFPFKHTFSWGRPISFSSFSSRRGNRFRCRLRGHGRRDGLGRHWWMDRFRHWGSNWLRRRCLNLL
jgi:hypothetical protein